LIKILYSKAEPFNGITSYTYHLYESLKESDVSVELKMLPKIEVKVGKKRYGGWLTQDLLSFTSGKADVVHSTTHWLLSPHTNVVTIHDLEFAVWQKNTGNMNNEKAMRRQKKFELIKKKAMMIIVQGKHVEDQVRFLGLDNPVEVIPSKVFVKPPNRNPYPKDNKLHLVTMGEILSGRQRKKIYEFYEWLKGNEDVDLYHIGKLENEKYRNYSPNIHELGFVSEQKKFNYLSYADKFVFNTLGEGQGYPTMEAMKLNTQVVVNDIPEHRSLLGDRPYYFHNRDEFLEMIWKEKKSGLVEQISQYDNWIDKYKLAYSKVAQDRS
jgi:hypothetical protein